MCFLVDNVKYLGYVISKDGIKADTSKIDAILKIEAPTNVTELRSFLGMINFYARFTRNLSSLLAPLHSLLRKEIFHGNGTVSASAHSEKSKER